MKRLQMIFVFLPMLLIAVTVGGCNRDDNPVGDSNAAMSEDDGADAIASALGGSGSTQGFSAQLEDASGFGGGNSNDGPVGNNQTNSDTVITRRHSGTYSFNYTFWIHWSFPSPTIFQFSYSMKGMYDTPRMSSNDSANASFTIGNLLTGAAYSFNGTYIRFGSQSSKVRNRLSFTSTLALTASDVLVSKANKKIQSGTATVDFSGVTSAGRTFAYHATVTFSGNEQAIMVINSIRYTVDLTLGIATRS